MTQIFLFRQNYKEAQTLKTHNESQNYKITTTKMQIQQKIHQMDKEIQKRLLMQLKLSKNEEVFNQCKQKYLKKLLQEKENYNQLSNIHFQISKNGQQQIKANRSLLMTQFNEYLDRSHIVFDYLDKQDKLKKIKKEISKNEYNQTCANTSQMPIAQKLNEVIHQKQNKALNQKSFKKKVKHQSLQKDSILNSQQSFNNSKTYKNIRAKGLSRIKSQILQNQQKLIDATSMLSYGFRTYQLNAYDQQKRIKNELKLKICKSTTNLKRDKTRKHL